MDFFDNVVNKSNAIIKERLNNPFGSKQSDSQEQPGGAAHRASQDGGGGGGDGGGGGPRADYQQTQASRIPTDNDNQSELTRATTEKHPSQDSANGAAEFRGGESDKNSQFAAIAADAEAVAQKAAKGAQKFGTFLFSMANKAGQTVSQTAKQVKQAVENTSILTDLTREQQEFVREHGGSLQAGELPWLNEPDEARSAYIREQILSLSQDKRNFVRAPPSDSDFRFDPKSCYPIALSLLREDPNLNKMRYELVPKLVNEDTFWCNYFYRVSMLKQMSEKGADAKKGWSSSRSSSGEGPDEVGSVDGHQTENEPFSPGYDTSSTAAAAATTTATSSATNTTTSTTLGYGNQQKQESFSLENTTAPSTRSDGSTKQDPQQQEQYQSNELESSESRKLVAEADDLKSKLRELNIGSFSLDGQDG
uniref:Synapse-associated protein n=1 Tax=Aceria tosichella TaxID=561515 RepID=A0A6G1SBC6_9ACAR